MPPLPTSPVIGTKESRDGRVPAAPGAFTPGPWWVPPSAPHNINSNPHNIAVAYFVNGEANARLIAAAPDLYEALETAARRFRDYERIHRAKRTDEGNLKADNNADLAEYCEAALAKARGGTKETKDGRVPVAPGSHPSDHAPAGHDPSRGALALREPTLEEATIEAITRATNAAFNWRGQEDLTPVMAINICAAAIAYLRAMPPGHSLEDMAVAIEGLKLALSSDSDRSGEAIETGTGSTEGKSAGPEGIAQPPAPRSPQ